MKDPYAPWASTKHPGIRKGTHQTTGAVRWRVYYRPPHSNQTSRTFNTLEEARRFRTEHELTAQASRDGRGRPAPRSTPTLAHFVEHRFLPRYTGDTRVMYAGAFRAVAKCDPELMAMPVGTIGAADIEIMLARLSEHYAPTTVNKARSAVGAALNRAADDGLIERLHARIPKRKAPKPQRPPSPAELHLVVQALPRRHRAVVLVGAAAGLRSGELRGLRTSDIGGLAHDMRQGWHRGPGPYTVSVAQQLDRMGRQTSRPKTEASERTIGVIPAVVDTIAGHLNEHGVGRDAMLWPMASETLRRAVARASQRAIGRTFKVHTLRRFYATQLVYGGVPVHDIQADLGHSDPAVTMGWYLAALEGQTTAPAKQEAFGPLFDAGAVLRLDAAKGR